MIINAVHLYSNGVKYAEFSLDQTDHTQRYIIKDATGWSMDEILPMYRGTGASTPRRKFFELKMQQRDIVMKIKLNPQYSLNETPSSLRDALYKAVSSYYTSDIELRFMNGATTVASISGFVTKFEALLFSSNPEIIINLRCDDAFLRDPAVVNVSLPAASTAPTIVDNISTAPHGFKFRLTLTSASAGIKFQKPGDGEWYFDIDYDFLNGDVLWFSSELNDRYLYVVRSGVTIHIADKLTAGSTWPLIFPGTNSFAVVMTSTTFTWNSITHFLTYWGV